MPGTRPIKTAKAFVGYHLRSFWRRRAVLNWVVLVVPLYIALALVIPPLQAPLRAAGLTIPSIARYEASGTVRTAAGKPAVGVSVSVGGYNASTDATGHYSLSFSSSSAEHICIVFDSNGTTTVEYEDAGPDNGIALDAVVA